MSNEEASPGPDPKSFLTPFGDKTKTNITKREFVIPLSSDESIKYLLEIEINEKNLNLSLKLKDEDINLFNYKKSFTLESLRKISKLFRLYDCIEEVIYYLFEELENNKQVLKADKNSNMLLIFLYQIPGAKKAEEIILCLEMENFKNEEINNLLIKEAIKMKNEIKELKEENNKLKLELNKINKICNIEEVIESKMKKYKEEIKIQFKEYESEINNLKEIINNYSFDDNSKFIKIFKEKYNEYKDKEIRMNLIYDAKIDGQNYSKCHKKCNNVENTLSIITTNKDKKFGFFRSIAINGQGPWKVDNKAFFISFDKSKIYSVKENQSCVAFDNSCFIQTKPFTLIGNILNDKYNCADKKNLDLYFNGFTEDYELNGGESDFTVNQFKVYKIEFKN